MFYYYYYHYFFLLESTVYAKCGVQVLRPGKKCCYLSLALGNQANKLWYYLGRGRETRGGSLVLVTCLVVITK